jgi:hypothetical protein
MADGGWLMDGRAIFQAQREVEFLHGKGTRSQAGAELIEQAIQEEGERLQQNDGIFQFHGFFKN